MAPVELGLYHPPTRDIGQYTLPTPALTQDANSPPGYRYKEAADVSFARVDGWQGWAGLDGVLIEVTEISTVQVTDIPSPDSILQSIRAFLLRILHAIASLFQPLLDKLDALAGQFETFVYEHPKEIAFSLGGALLAIGLAVLCGPAVLRAAGVEVWGPMGGSFLRFLQSIAVALSKLLGANVKLTAVLALVLGLGVILYFALQPDAG